MLSEMNRRGDPRKWAFALMDHDACMPVTFRPVCRVSNIRLGGGLEDEKTNWDPDQNSIKRSRNVFAFDRSP